MNARASWLLLLLPYLLGVDLLRANNKNIAQGNARLLKGEAQAALELYDKALAEDGLSNEDERAAAEFNRGAALSALNKHDEASRSFLEATKSKDVSLRARAFYNLGNTFFQGEKYSEAIEAYKRSLVLDSKASDAKWNLELALRRKRDQDEKKQQNEDKNQQDKDKQDKNNQDPNKQDQGDSKQDPSKQQGGDDQPQKQDPAKEQPGDKTQPKNEPENEGESGAQDPQKPEGTEPEQPAENQQKPDPSPSDDNKQPSAATAGEAQGTPKAGPDMKEINAILDSLEQSPQEIERQRARMRAVRRRPPVKDW